MKTKLFFVSFAAVSLLFLINSVRYSLKKRPSYGIALYDVEAKADFGEYWFRPDYVCIPVTCNCVIYKYQSKVAAFVGDGKGEVPHMWNYTGCDDCSWVMD